MAQDVVNGRDPAMPSFFGGGGGALGSSWNGTPIMQYPGLTAGIQGALGLPTMADVGPIFDAQNSSGPNKSPCSETDEQIVRDASVNALSHINPHQDESKNITQLNFNFARVVNPTAVSTKGWKKSFTTHGTAIESPIIPGQKTFDVKMYSDPKLGNTVAVVYPTSSPMHFLQWPLYEIGVHVNAENARSYFGCPNSSGGH